MPQALPTGVFATALLSAACLWTSACFGLTEAIDEGNSCRNDGDCQEACSPIGECIIEATALNIRVSWSINGVSPSPQDPAPCASITDFEVRFASTREDDFAFFPVPCENGTVFYPKMPARLIEMTLTGVNEFGNTLVQDSREIIDTESQFAIDLSL